ncbi:SDR family oxidoreductase [Pseudomonas sp. 21LCFQ02]|uniref:SDR family oxidoreductase n=1 Tax=Pseudomonas sp. 21LCFQ02 TaxID=2957505 RepID=UPI00209AEF5F|nr:SDR family oxidoreductase [Pseudomonas sp. 21LCFQ02]MCO8169350.1 SDR family oxidoreductase [Pseudomonas sp. 21LCFQ02]MCO8171040.1 SDR family oxidoreductase [Pseudomonas sp. 21LCFQ02]
MSKNIEGKVVVITGASSGLGESTARHLASLGASVVLAARREDRLNAIVQDITAAGGKATALVADVTRREDLENLIQHAVASFGRVDVMINNAGLMAISPIAELRVDEWDRMIDINIKGVMYGIAAALPVFQKQNSGHFINISSVAGIKVFSPGGSVYSGTKYAVRAISDGLRHEVGKSIRTTTIEPGAVDSELKFGSGHEASSQAVQEFYKSAIPAESVARAIAFAIEQPADVDINEIVLRPTSQDF